MPSTEDIHAEEQAFWDELQALPGYAEASAALAAEIRSTIENFRKKHGLTENARKWEFSWSHSPYPARNFHQELMADFPGVKEIKRKYRRE